MCKSGERAPEEEEKPAGGQQPGWRPGALAHGAGAVDEAGGDGRDEAARRDADQEGRVGERGRELPDAEARARRHGMREPRGDGSSAREPAEAVPPSVSAAREAAMGSGAPAPWAESPSAQAAISTQEACPGARPHMSHQPLAAARTRTAAGTVAGGCPRTRKP